MRYTLEDILTPDFVDSHGYDVPGADDESIIVVPPPPLNPSAPDYFADVRAVLYAGERVYPNDPHFMKRFGRGSLEHVEEGIDDKIVFALVAPGRVRAGVAVHLLCLPESNSVVDLAKFTLDSDTVREAKPEHIQNPGEIKAPEPFAITSLTGGDGLQTADDPIMSRGSGKRLMGGLLLGMREQFYVATISPKIPYSVRPGDPPPLVQAVTKAIASMDAERDRDFHNINLVQKFHMGGDSIKGAAGIASFVFNGHAYNPRYGYGNPDQLADNEDHYRAGILPISGHLYDELPKSLKERCYPMPSRVQLYQPPHPAAA